MLRPLPPSAYASQMPSFTTRRTAVNPFGTPRLKSWLIPEEGKQEGRQAAELQRHFSLQLRAAINPSEEGSIAEFVRQHSQISYERMPSILPGDASMRLEDIAILMRHLGLKSAISFKKLPDELIKNNN
jgi:hypothetical protein